MLLRPPKFIKKIYPSFIWSFPKEEDGLFLTFDDGPCPQVTPWVLDQLDKYGAKATFFCIGKNVEQYPVSGPVRGDSAPRPCRREPYL